MGFVGFQLFVAVGQADAHLPTIYRLPLLLSRPILQRLPGGGNRPPEHSSLGRYSGRSWVRVGGVVALTGRWC